MDILSVGSREVISKPNHAIVLYMQGCKITERKSLLGHNPILYDSYTIQTNLLFSDVSLNVVCRIPSISGKRLFPCMCCSIETNSLLMVHTENHLGKF